MNNLIFKWSRIFIIAPFLFFILSGCNGHKSTSSKKSTAALSPKESLNHFKLEKGFDIRLVAAEPLIQAPVAIRFDAKGRIWAVEMQGYMPDTSGTDETTSPTGKIVILEDTDKDGIMDTRKVFMDSLILPRAISFYGEGLLVAEPPRLWFVKIDNDTAGAKYLVDSGYAVGGNVEHQPNGLLRGLDNWIYNAKSDTRYRRINGKWVKQHTHFRGQWGITQDDYGRLFYNNNSANLLGDYFLPGLGAWNPDQKRVSGFDETIVSDTRTYPIHPTPGVNRGYQPGILDSTKRLVHFTAASGPVIYRSNLFGPDYKNNAFVPAPAANLIKRDILHFNGYKVTGKQAWQGKEFLASDDERFRPVSLYNGPDGALYIVDMYRGIIQDITYLTPYLKGQIGMRNLAQPLNRGRIYKIVPKGKDPASPVLYGKSTEDLAALLDSPNPWVRKTAQRLIVDGSKTEAEPLLRKKLQSDTFLIGKIQAFWTLEGLGKLQDTAILPFLHSKNIHLQQQAIAAIVSGMNKNNVNQWLKEAAILFKNKEKELSPYIAFLAAKAMQFNPDKAQPLLLKLALTHPDNKYVADAVISGLQGHEQTFFQEVNRKNEDTASVLYRHLRQVILQTEQRKRDEKKKANERFKKGKILFATYCKVCHGSDGAGIRALGAPLDGSQWVTGNKQTLLNIVLHGVTGPIQVGNKLYKEPEVGGEMPGFAGNEKLSDEDLAEILSYIRSAWSNNANAVNATDVSQARERNKDRKHPFTMKELQKP